MARADQRIEVFDEAKALRPGAERDAFLEKACKDQPELMEQVLSLLQAHEAQTIEPRIANGLESNP
jgi:hypothetical protein